MLLTYLFLYSNYLLNKLDNLFEVNNNSNGYIEFDNGIIIQWFLGNTSTTSSIEVNYPKPFKIRAFQVYATYDYAGGSMAVAGAQPYSKSACLVRSKMIDGSGNPTMRFLAIGY
ncbi:gp53-like domain-containing protein [Fusobacterium mortiferum]|uniref:Putative tail fiber protein gp53-like C-terminal domain-containing protein n=1 Tax=Fusobacterium mortiferum TaxID=850 RepID=A0ABS2G2J5_FUSMR|nr:hypothetical protein [Fusobacterium mortiferum]MBM6875649.1 hypothetical protein [Fusobacterium mortiferum]